MIGFIGVGNMASAIIKGMISNGISGKDIYLHNRTKSKLESLGGMGINKCESNCEVVKKCKYIFLAVKPNMYPDVLNEIKDCLKDEHIIITMAAGFSIEDVKKIVGNIKVCRTMPNTPALVGSGITAVCFDDLLEDTEKEKILFMIKTFGEAQVTAEGHINAYSVLTGSSPAFVFMMIEAMADAGVLLGIPRGEAYKAAEAAVLGSAKLALETGMHPGQLKDMVCSPGGTTIEGVRTLEEKGFRSAVVECMINTYKKNLDIENIR